MRFEKLPIEDITLDPQNPRVNELMMNRNDPNQEEIQSALAERDQKFIELKTSITNFGGIFNSIIVAEQDKDDYLVIEGNTRVHIYKEFSQEEDMRELNEDGWKKIPAVIYNCKSEKDKKLLEQIRLQAHILGPREWKPINKARYIAHLRDNDILSWDEIKDIIGGNTGELKHAYTAYQVYIRTYRPYVQSTGDSDDEKMRSKFSGLVEFSKNNIDHLLKEDFGDESEKVFSEWLYHGNKWGQLNEIRKLKNIFSDNDKKKIFLGDGGTVKEALKVHEGGNNIPPDTAELCDLLYDKVHIIDNEEWERIKSEEDRTVQSISHLQAELARILDLD